MPSIDHESAISAACEQDGFITHSFAAFARACAINGKLGGKLFEPEQLFREISGHDEYNSGFWQRIKNEMKKEAVRAEVYLCSEIIEGAVLNAGSSIDDYFAEYWQGFNRNVACVPDAWRFSDGQIDVLEVTDTSGVKWRNLTSLGFVDDELFHACGVRVNLAEYRSGNKTVFNHNLVYPFCVAYDYFSPDGIHWLDFMDKPNTFQMRVYYREASFTNDDYRPVVLSFTE